MHSKSIDQLAIGDRVSVDGHKATVLYLGTVEGTKGSWVGVEWDVDGRGKHDGSHNGVKYFDTRGATTGSFIRVDKANTGCSVVEAAIERYNDRVTELEDFAIGSKQIELVGMDVMYEKQKNLNKLRNVVLDFTDVSHCGEPSVLSAQLTRCELLDVTCSLMSCWSEVLRIVSALPTCNTLNLSRNRLKPLTEDANKTIVSENHKTDRLTSLIMNDVNYVWEQVVPVLTHFKQVRMLGLCRNRITRITELPPNVLTALTTIDLEENLITDWNHIRPLAALPCLESINLSRNEIKSITFDENWPSDEGSLFPSLVELILRGCAIEQWQSVQSLKRLGNLQRLVLYGNPVLNSFPHETSRQVVIARLPKLKSLDRQIIIMQERRGAEIDYLKRFGKEWLPAKEDTADPQKLIDFYAEHPQYERLIEVYGAPDKAEIEGIQRTGLLKDRLLKVMVTSDKMAKPVERAVPGVMTVSKLRSLCARLCKMPARDAVLVYVPIARPEQRIPLDNDLRQLQYYCMEDGDVINVETL